MPERAVRGRVIARLLLLFALALVSVLILLYLTQPVTMGGGVELHAPSWPRYLIGASVVGIVGGLVWMIRIDRAARDPERHQSFWRSRR